MCTAPLDALEQLARLPPPASGPNSLRPEAVRQLVDVIGGDSASCNSVLALLAQLAAAAQGPPAVPEEHVLTLSLKLFQATPDTLPPTLLGELRSWMAKTPTYTEGERGLPTWAALATSA